MSWLRFFGLAGELRRALALLDQGLLHFRLALLALLDEQRQAQAVIGEHAEIAVERLTFRGNLLAQAQELGEIRGQGPGLFRPSRAAPPRASWPSAPTAARPRP